MTESEIRQLIKREVDAGILKERRRLFDLTSLWPWNRIMDGAGSEHNFAKLFDLNT